MAAPEQPLEIKKKDLHNPTLQTLQSVFAEAMKKNFAESSVEIVDCPDLTQEPFHLAAPGLGGKSTVLEVGGPAYLLPLAQREKVYELKSLINQIQYDGEKSFVIGAGAGPWPYLNTNCELMMNVLLEKNDVKNSSRIASVNQQTNGFVLQTLPKTETRLALLANLFLSEGKPGKVLKVHAKKRTGSDDFIACMQKALASFSPDKLVGLGGTFLLKEGKAKQHVMPDFSKTPLDNVDSLNHWLHFYDMSAPLVAVGTFVSAETDLDLRVQHFHSFSNHNEGGHYHNDVTPDSAEYLGYFNIGETLVRIDQPPYLLQFGKD